MQLNLARYLQICIRSYEVITVELMHYNSTYMHISDTKLCGSLDFIYVNVGKTSTFLLPLY